MMPVEPETSSASTDVGRLFIDYSRKQLVEEFWPRMRACVESLNDEQVWWRPNDASNSVGNLLLHLNGNVRQWLVASFTRSDDTRNRPAEFAQRHGIARAVLLDTLGETIDRAAVVLSQVTDADLRRTLDIQGYRATGLEAIYHVVEHFGMHYGQIVYITKLLRGADLGFYRELDETGRLE